MFNRTRAFLKLIKFEHTIFALPFAYLGMVLAARGFPDLNTVLWITIAMAAGRTVGMTANRIFDRHLDALNPRTSQRPLITGQVQPSTAWVGLILASASLILAAYQLGPLPLQLTPIAFLFLLGYPLTKRFTILSHLILGLTDGLAPMGAWLAVRGSIFQVEDAPAWLLLAVVALWITGFDLIYACQDAAFDKRLGLHAIPARFGLAVALRLSAVLHAMTTILLVLLGMLTALGWPYWIGVIITAGLLAYEHAIVWPDDLSRIDIAFFNINSLISIVLFISTSASVLIV